MSYEGGGVRRPRLLAQGEEKLLEEIPPCLIIEWRTPKDPSELTVSRCPSSELTPIAE